MKSLKIFKKPRWFTMITALCLVVVALCAASGCDKSKTPPTNYVNGIIIGYAKCLIKGDDVIGLFIITEKQDSLLSFNIPLSSINIDPNSLRYGSYGMKRNNINFTYRIAVGDEIKQMIDFLCPQNDMDVPFLGGPIENYTQIIVTDIKLTTP